MQRKVNVVEDFEGNKIVLINDIKFKGRQSIEWTDVEDYLKQYICVSSNNGCTTCRRWKDVFI